jgi:hypothetical protein
MKLSETVHRIFPKEILLVFLGKDLVCTTIPLDKSSITEELDLRFKNINNNYENK